MKILYANAIAPLETAIDQPGILNQISGGYSITKPNCKILSIRPDGSYGERDAVGGSYEIFQKGNYNFLIVTPGSEVNNSIPYVIWYRFA